MVTHGGSVRPNSTPIFSAVRTLFAHFKGIAGDSYVERSEQDALNALWAGEEAPPDHKLVLSQRASHLILRALLSGDLHAHFSDGLDSCDVPGWAWETEGRAMFAWGEGRLPLNVFLPEEWQRWSCHSVYLDRDAFTEWMDRQPLHDPAGLPALPPPHDAQSKPEPVKRRLPPDTPFVTLSEALTWIAFGFALDRDSLDRAISGHAFDATDPQVALADAMAKLAVRASGGQISTRGKYVESHSTDENKVLTAPIDPVRFEDFAQFDILYDGLRYGTGLTWEKQNNTLDRVLQARRDAFREVKVSRADLLEYFPMPVEPVPLAISVGELSLPEEDFDPSAHAEISPWWTVLQAIAWVTTRSPAYVERVGQLEAHNNREIAQFICSSSVFVYVSRNACTCSAKSLDSTSRWESCTCFRDAGRLILEQIRQGHLRPIQMIGGVSRTMAFHEFAGVGQRPSGADWHDLKPAPIFSSAEFIAAIPSSQRPDLGNAGISVEAFELPSEEMILKQMLELKQAGLSRDAAAKRIREIHGFEQVGNEHARRVVAGHFTRGRPPKNRARN